MHFPWSRLRRTLSVILALQARTFLIPFPFGSLPVSRAGTRPRRPVGRGYIIADFFHFVKVEVQKTIMICVNYNIDIFDVI